MTEFIISNWWLLWTVIAVVCLTLEMSSGDFYITCFAVGAVCSVAVSLLGAPFWVQVLVFAMFSILSVWLLRPRLLRLTEAHADRRVSNSDALIGRIGEVSETIEAHGYGRVKIDGDDWKAESCSPQNIEKGEKVKVTGRESIILKVEKAQQQ